MSVQRPVLPARGTPPLPPDVAAHVPTGLLVAGAWAPSSSGQTFEVADPATEEVLFDVADGTPEDADRALGSAWDAWRAWRAVAPRERSELLRAVYQRVVNHREDFAALITAECGKPLAEARSEVDYGADFLRWYAEQAVRFEGLYRPAPAGGARQLVSRRPVGPALLVTPWNFPIAMLTRKLAPAFAAGCTVVVKPARLTPLTTLALAEILRSELADRDLPVGVVNVVPTSSASAVTGPLLADPRLRKLSFTGSTGVGRTLLEAAAGQVLRTSMELGGNAPFLVFEDADLDAAVSGALVAKLRNTGQSCVAANRFLVHDEVADEFASRLATAFAERRTGRGTEAGVDVGPLIEASAVEKVGSLVQGAVDDGARVLVGGERPEGPGFFYAPTVLGDVPPDAALLSEEIFGPVAPITRFGSDEEALRLANGTEYGLVAYAYTRDVGRALRLTEELEAGMIGINRGLVSDASTPFGGLKQSGLGREGGEAGIEEYQETVYAAVQL